MKYWEDRSIERHKVRLIAKGYTETYEANYSGTSVLIVRIKYYQNLVCHW